jgi:hypothetical protein
MWRVASAMRGLGGKLKRSDHLKEVGVDGTLILKFILNKYDERAWTGLIWLRKGKSIGLL